jgi:two-component sensor histidine kinase
VHHRVKNNLQTVASILRMQARRTDSAEARILLHEAVNRLLAVSVIHEFLSDYAQQSINIRDVCQRIATQTQRAVVQPDKQITLQTLGPAIYLSSQQATTCALVANELLLNALEHGFNDRDSGAVTLRLEDLGDQIMLEVADDGSGLPVDFDLATADSLGLSIVRTLVEGDLRGTFILEPAEPGTRAAVVFKKGQQDDT